MTVFSVKFMKKKGSHFGCKEEEKVEIHHEILLQKEVISDLYIYDDNVIIHTTDGECYNLKTTDEGVDFLLWWFREEARLSYEAQKENYNSFKHSQH